MTASILHTAVAAALDASLAVIPPTEDGQKRPIGGWKAYQKVAPTRDQVRAWYLDGAAGLGVLTGAVSGGLEMLELEGRAIEAGILDEFIARGEATGLGELVARIRSGYTETTPSGGLHWLYRVETPLGNTKLARRQATAEELAADPADRIKVLIETRGEGGYVITAPSNGKVHPTGGRWTLTEGGFATLATITDDERDSLFELARTFDRMPVEPPRPPPGPTGGDRPGDRYNDAPDAEERMEALLLEHGWAVVYRHEGVTYLRRPGKKIGTSATIGRHPGLFYVFSSSTEFEVERGYRPFGVYTILEHGGDYKAAAKALADDEPKIEFISKASGWSSTTTIPPNLPATFWEARPVLGRIRDAAWSRQRSPDAVFAGVLTRVTASLPHTIALPAIVGTPAGTGIVGTVVSPSGVGKTTGAGIAEELLDGGIETKTIPGGTGEGMVEAFFEMVEETDPNTGKTKKVKRQAWHNLHIYIDEITKTLSVAKRDGATVNEMFRQAFSGSTLGEHNASAERRRVVARGEYSIGILIAAQPHVLGPLFDDADAGTPTRFIFLSGTDPSIPETSPAWPGTIDVALPEGWNVALAGDALRIGSWRHHVVVDDAIVTEVRGRDLVKVHGLGDGDPWTGHRDLIRLKVAFVIAVLDHRVDVRPTDWQLAGTVVETSDAVRRHAQAVVDAVGARQEKASADRSARRAVTTDVAVEESKVERLARRITRTVLARPGELSRSEAKRGLESTVRSLGDDAIEYALSRQWIAVKTEPGQGSDKERLVAGVVEMPK